MILTYISMKVKANFIASLDKTAGGTTEYMRLLGTALVEDMELVIACGASFKTHSH
jgi:hypothetical protein